MAAKLPHIITRTHWRLKDALLIACNNRRDRLNLVRSDFLGHLVTVAGVLLNAVSLRHDGQLIQIMSGTFNGARWAKPLRVAEITRRARLPQRTVERALAVLHEIGFLRKIRQDKRKLPEGGWEVTAVRRAFSEEFWRAVGLFNEYKEAVAKAMAKFSRTIRLVHSTYIVGQKRQTAARPVQAVRQMLGGLLDKMSIPTGSHERTRDNPLGLLRY